MPKLTPLMSLLMLDGNVTVDVPAAIATDTAGNNNTAATQLVRTANVTTPDITPPTVALTSTSTPTVTGLFSVTATFSEDVTALIILISP
jgi:hypothetical protein